MFTAQDAKRAFEEFNADAVMIARGAIDHPWIFRETRYLLETGRMPEEVTYEERILTALKHLKYQIEIKDAERHAVIPFRKYYSGYLKGLHRAKYVRQELMKFEEYAPVEELLLNYLEELTHYSQLDPDESKSIESS